MIKILRKLFGKPDRPKWKCTYCGRPFDNPIMAKICHDLDLKIKRYGIEEIKKQKEKVFGE